ncbi:hypothetical protein D3C81_1459170 [compost metagenome]
MYPWNDRVGTILLDVAVITLIHKSGFLFIFMLLRPDHAQVVVNCRSALGTSFRVLPFQNIHNLSGRSQFHGPDCLHHFLTSEWRTAADPLFNRGNSIGPEGIGQQVRNQWLTTTTAASCFGAVLNVINTGASFLLDGLQNGSFRYTITSTYNFVIRHSCHEINA